MNKSKKKVLIFAGLSAAAVAFVAFGCTSNLANSFMSAEVTNYEATFNGSNGAISTETATLKTRFADASTKLGNPVKVNFKKCTAVSGKVGTIEAGGKYALETPIIGMTKIIVSSSASVGDAKLSYGLTSACLDGEVDLATGTIEIGEASFFRIEATNQVTINSIKVESTCVASSSGAVGCTFVDNGDSYGAGKDLYPGAVKKIVVPDYYWTDDARTTFKPVTSLVDISTTGIAENCSILEKFYMPETIQSISNWAFNKAAYVTEFTLPRDLKTVSGSNYIPKDTVKVLNYNSKSFTASSAANLSNVETINVSYDVESLCDYVVNKANKDKTLVNYEGTEAEWAKLIKDTTYWKQFVNVVCSDTEIGNVVLHFENATLNGAENSFSTKVIIGKTFADPGKPTYKNNEKRFVGWFTAAEGGSKVSFPLTINDDVEIYAQFEDWPSGSTEANPRNFSVGDEIDLFTTETNNFFYLEHTSTEDEIFTLTLSGIVKTGGTESSTTYQKWQVFDKDGNEVKIAGTSTSIENDVEKFSISSADNVGPLKVRMKAGEKYSFRFSFYYNTYSPSKSYYADATLKVEGLDETKSLDYTTAGNYTVGNVTTFDVYEDFINYSKFTVETSGNYLVNIGKLNDSVAKTQWTGTTIFHFDSDGKYVKDVYGTASGDSKSALLANLTAGVQYYIGITGNTDGVTQFELSTSVPSGIDFSNAIEANVGTTTTLEYVGFSNAYIKFNVTGVNAAPSRGGVMKKKIVLEQSANRTLTLYKEDMKSSITLSKGDSDLQKYVDLENGTYYLKVSMASGVTDDVTISEAVPGCAKFNPITDVAWSENTFEATATAKGNWYKYTPAATEKYDFIAPTGVEVTVAIGSNTTVVEAGKTGILSETNGTDVYLCFKAESESPVTLTRTVHVGPLTGWTGNEIHYNGCRNGTSYYKLMCHPDTITWEGSTHDITSCEDLGDMYKVTTTNTSNRTNWLSKDGRFAWTLDNNDVNPAFLTTLQTHYDSTNIAGKIVSQSGYTAKSGFVMQSVKIDAGSRVYGVMYNGEVFLGVSPVVTEGELFSSACTFTVTLGATTYTVVCSSATNVSSVTANE